VDSDGKAFFAIGPVQTCTVLEILVINHHAPIVHFEEKKVRQEDKVTIHLQNLQRLEIWQMTLAVYPGW
jgi:hypothetical protein